MHKFVARKRVTCRIRCFAQYCSNSYILQSAFGNSVVTEGPYKRERRAGGRERPVPLLKAHKAVCARQVEEEPRHPKLAVSAFSNNAVRIEYVADLRTARGHK